MGFIKNIFSKIAKMSRPTFSFDDDELKFKITSDKIYSHNIDNYEMITSHDSYTFESYTLNFENVFIEYIHLDIDSRWNGEASKLFMYMIERELKINSKELLENKSYKNYDFKVFDIDGEYRLNFIHIYEVDKDILILDFDSKFYTMLMKQFDNTYIYPHEKNPSFKFNLDFSLVNENTFYNHFEHENTGS